jgi:hypothetical protein
MMIFILQAWSVWFLLGSVILDIRVVHGDFNSIRRPKNGLVP